MKNSTSPLKREILAGLTTFVTVAYIIVVNPSILSTSGTGIPFSGALTATVLLAFSMTLLMGLYADLPFAVAPGMGINAFFTFSLILGKQIPWPIALGMIFWAGVVFLILSVIPLREKIAEAIPLSLRQASAVGIGLFLTLIGLKNAGLVIGDPVTLVKLGKLGFEPLLSLLGLVITAFFLRRKNPLAFLMGVLGVTLIAVLMGRVAVPETLFSAPDFESVLFKLDIWGALRLAFVPAILAICFTDLFDSISTFIGVSYATGLVDKNGKPKNIREGLLVDAFATLGAGLLGTSSGTAYIESAAGIEAGGRTGKSAVVTAFCFLPFLFVAPLVGMIPGFATAPVLILVGALMFKSVSQLSFEHWEEYLPSFLTIILIPLTFSITQGMLWGFISHVLFFILTGRRKEISPTLAVIALISVGLVVMENG